MDEIILWPDDPAIRMVFRPIPPGTFWMGSRGYEAHEEPRHQVHIPPVRDADDAAQKDRPAFWAGSTPVTQAQFALWTGSPAYSQWLEENEDKRPTYGDLRHKNHFGPEGNRPVDSVTWWEADAYCIWLNETQGKGMAPHGVMARLPGEAHWEYACQGGLDTEYGLGDGEGVLDAMGWYDANSGSETHPVGEKRPNGYGLYDMHGNVWEWCRDAWDEAIYRRRIDGEEAQVVAGESATNRVLRGGSWSGSARYCRAASRDWDLPGFRYHNQGFRVFLLPGPVDPASPGGARQGAEAEPGAGPGGGTPEGRAPGDAEAARPLNPLEDAQLPHRPTDPEAPKP